MIIQLGRGRLQRFAQKWQLAQVLSTAVVSQRKFVFLGSFFGIPALKPLSQLSYRPKQLAFLSEFQKFGRQSTQYLKEE